MAKQNNAGKAEEIRARLARRIAEEPNRPPAAEPGSEAALQAATAHFLGSIEEVVKGRGSEQIPIGKIAPETRESLRQPRLIPLPEELLLDGRPNPLYVDLVRELQALGESLRERQIQPIVVYRGSSAMYPNASYLILVGHRRWTAATLVGLESLSAVVVDPPSQLERLRIQYAENEAREDFSDMERAWALQQMKQALGAGATWETVEAEFGMSETRRHELARLLSFTPAQQEQVALMRLQETQVRSLHSALRKGELNTQQVDAVLRRLHEITGKRSVATAPDSLDAAKPPAIPGRRGGVDGPTVARIVAQVKRSGAAEPTRRPRWVAPLREHVQQTSQSLQRAVERVASLPEEDADALRVDLIQLRVSLSRLLERLDSPPAE